MNKCPECSLPCVIDTQIENYTFDQLLGGVLYKICVSELPVLQCTACKEQYFINKTYKAMTQAVRDHLNLLPPDEIKRIAIKNLATTLKLPVTVVNAWVMDWKVQTPEHDKLLRALNETTLL